MTANAGTLRPAALREKLGILKGLLGRGCRSLPAEPPLGGSCQPTQRHDETNQFSTKRTPIASWNMRGVLHAQLCRVAMRGVIAVCTGFLKYSPVLYVWHTNYGYP